MNPLAALFDRLDRWRSFANYQLERRADIFFSLYLAEVLGQKVGLAIDPRLFPEFPLKLPMNNLSNKADYFLLSQDKSAGFLLELKTEMSSKRETQDSYLKSAQQKGLRLLLQEFLVIWEASNSPQKYFHNAELLASLGLLELPASMESSLFPQVSRFRFQAALRQINLSTKEVPIQVWYIQPNENNEENVIDFLFFASVLDRYDDELSVRFRESLRRWSSR